MIGAKLKIALLYDVWNEDPIAAAEKEEAAPARKPRKKVKKVKKEMTDREEIFEALQKLGHEPSYFELDGRPQSLHSLSRCDADLLFNLTESFDGDDTKEMNVVAYIDLLGLRYTGAGPHAIILAQDKAIAKKIFAFHGIKTPRSSRLPIADASNMPTTFLFRSSSNRRGRMDRSASMLARS